MKSRTALRSIKISVTAAVLGAGFVAASASSAADMTVRLAWYMPPHTAVSQQGNEIAKKIKALSNGDIKVQTYPSGSLLNESNMAQGIQNNTTNMGILAMHWWSSKAPALEWDTIPFLVDDASSLLQKLHGSLGQRVNQKLNQYGVQIIGWGFYGYAESYINAKHAIKTPSDLKGLKMRSEGKLNAQFLKSEGAIPVAMDSSEVYTSMQRGTLDGGVSGLSSVISRKWFEVGKYVTPIHYVPLVYPIQVNKDWWKGLSDKQRQIISKAVKSTEKDDVSRIEKEYKSAIQTMKKHGNDIHQLSKKERQTWRKATESQAKKNYIDQVGKAGQKYLDAVSSQDNQQDSDNQHGNSGS